MTAAQLKRILDQISDDTEILVARTRYNGYMDETTIEQADLYLTDEGLLLVDEITAKYIEFGRMLSLEIFIED